jgi:lysophospholipase L1-like esterase
MSAAGPTRIGTPQLALWALAQLVLALAAAWAYSAWASSLERAGQWVATKATLARGVMGADRFLRGGQSVSGRRLNLGAWHGFHEVLYRAPLRPTEIELDFELFPRAHLSVIFGRTGEGFSGVRLSLDPARESMVFEASALGEFTRRAPMPGAALEARKVHHLRLAIEGDAVEVAVDGSSLGRFDLAVPEPGLVGVRGGGRMSIVDNLVIGQRGSGPTLEPEASVYESFGARAEPRAVGLALLLVVLANLAAFGATPANSGERRQRVLALIVGNATLAVMTSLLVVFLEWRAERYPAADALLRASEDAWRLSEAGEIRAAIRRRHAVPPPAGTVRVLLIGSSQTWGSGASRESETIAAALERLLQAGEPRVRYEVVNGGVSAADSALLLSIFEEDWASLAARAVVVNLSNNDADPAAFARNLERMATLVRRAGGQPLFVLEANSPEDRRAELEKLAAKHEAMRRVGREQGVPVVDMHGYLLENQDRGFLFWDFAHLTSLGQKLFAERLYPEVRRLLDGFGLPRP